MALLRAVCTCPGGPDDSSCAIHLKRTLGEHELDLEQVSLLDV